MKRRFLGALFTLATAAVFGQTNGSLPKASYMSNRLVPEGPTMVPGYNAPSRIDVRNSWDLYLTGSFIYWNPREEGLDLGVTNVPDASGNIYGVMLDMKFPYKMGFKTGLGIHTNTDNWDVYTEYTWFHMSHRHGSGAPSNGSLIPAWLFLSNEFTPGSVATSVAANWLLDMDIIDLELGRCFYVGTCLTFRPYFGGRLDWIKQRYHLRSDPDEFSFVTGSSAEANARSTSWGLGPRAGVAINYLMNYGIRFFGKVNASILYTSYRVIYRSHQIFSPGLNIKVKDKVAYLRPNFDMALGIGWGMYYCNYRYHIDFAASYDFQVFWNQNMMRHLADRICFGNDGTYGNLYLQGLTFTARWDF